jgi:polar amino acid transport system substrate-binding protein
VADQLYEKWYGQGSKLKFGKRTWKIETDKVDS